MEAGIRHFIIGLGGSSTSDCGVGMLQALGYIFCDDQGKPVGTGGQEVGRIASVDDSRVLPALKDCTFDVACDVTNPLFGNWGAAYIFGPQKGASPQDVKVLDDASRSFAAVTQMYTGHDFSQTAGAGAAGGMGFAFLAYLHGRLRSGIQIVLDSTTADAVECNRQGIDAFFSIVDKAMPLEEAMNKETALRNMTNTAQQVFNLIRAVG